MRKVLFVLPMLLTIIFSQASIVHAQYDEYNSEEMKLVNLHAGAAFLTGDTGNDTTYIVGLEIEGRLPDFPYTNISGTLDYMPIDSLTNGTVNLAPMLVGIKTYVPYYSYQLFVGAAIGARWASENIPELDIDQGFSFAWSATAGINITPNFFGQFRFIAGTDPSTDGAFTAELGFRF